MNAIRRLLNDHEEVQKLFNQYLDAGEQAYKQKKSIVDQIINKITVHAELEEKIIFPALQAKDGEDAEEVVLEGIEEHKVTVFIMDGLKQTPPEDKKFHAKYTVLMESAKHHFQEEERDLFPKAKKSLKGELDRLGEEMDKLEKKLTK